MILLLGGVSLAAAQQQAMPPQQKVDPSSITDQELQQFADASQQAQQIQMQAQQDIRKIVNDHDMKFQRFQQIMMSKQNPQMKGKVNVTDAEQQKIQDMKPAIMKVQQNNQKKMMTAIDESGLERQRFQQIFMALQQNKKLMQRFQKVMQDSAGQQQ